MRDCNRDGLEPAGSQPAGSRPTAAGHTVDRRLELITSDSPESPSRREAGEPAAVGRDRGEAPEGREGAVAAPCAGEWGQSPRSSAPKRSRSPGAGNTGALTPPRKQSSPKSKAFRTAAAALPANQGANTTAPLLLGCRVDALEIVFAADLKRGAIVELDLAQYQACNAGTPIDHRISPGFGPGITFALYPNPAGGKQFRLVNADATVLVGSDRHGFTIKVELRSMYLATHFLAEAIELARRIARWIAPYEDEVVRRVDLCADATGVCFDRLDTTSFVGRARRSLQYQTIRTYAIKRADDLVFTGFVVGRNKDVHVRLYDKTEELRTQHTPDSEKVRTELAAARVAGWNEKLPIWRLEGQLRGKALKELGLSSPNSIAERLDGTWRYLFGNPDASDDDERKAWLRLVVRDERSRPERCPVDPRWQVYQRADFCSASKTAVDRVAGRRGGASMQQSIGTVLSTLGGIGRLHTEAATAPKLLRKNLNEFCRLASGDADLMRHLPTRVAAVAARFSSTDDEVTSDSNAESA